MKLAIKLYDGCIHGLAGLAALIVASLAFLIVVDVALRSFGYEPPAATVALTEYALLYFTMAAAPWLVRKRGHVAVRIVFDRLSPSTQRWWEYAIYGLSAVVAFSIAAIAGTLLVESLILGDVEQRSIDVPRWLLFLPLMIGFLGVGMEMLRFPLTGTSFYASDDPAGPEKI
ncbi:MAG: TRAP transporter small permease subunit [Rhodospirillaceae bacterium]|jgi:C4-dicarboxylate transporter, DctQ subunit|nr:TRAP transporter small permease subunit [Rhodospirillaceae bacterium]MBT5240746.1 TRAP transporter small permease subunit [Rhodospirillaceae bacterium]MBT5564064.1 TRAP transporter small permease subunit [Rhodospirillaceae bacterium]MBT6091046.1 TRAP transporter small permease subunit [Rhodospirillaceae bacterium]MBT6961115.1 TRAP transporter small permease subunit [Rhodospirillaceae bacterium]